MQMRPTFVPLVALLLAAGCQQEVGNETAATENVAAPAAGERSGDTIGDALATSGEHGRFMQAVEQAGLAEALRGAGPYTVFAPADQAFQGETGDQAGAGQEQQVSRLSYHIVPGMVTREDLARAAERGEGGRAELATMAGQTISVMREGDTIVLTDAAGGQARILRAAQIHSNGVVHSIDGVLSPGGQ